MEAARDEIEVGVADLRAHLGRYLHRVEAGESMIVTMQGRAVARLAPLGSNANRLEALITAGAVRPAKRATRNRPARRVKPRDPVSNLVGEQRR